MIKNVMIALAVKAFQAALCQFFGICIDFEECPDGVCDETLQAIDDLDESAPNVVVAPGKTQALNFDLNWDAFPALSEAAKAFVVALRAFLGLSPKVG